MTVSCTEKSQELQKNPDELTKWERDWQMPFNPDKCYVMRLMEEM